MPSIGHSRGDETLGAHLARLRSAAGMTLREVEEATAREVSNAYLSQLENGKISKPSPNILYALASVYGAPYEKLMELAGYLVSEPKQSAGGRHGRVAALSIKDLTADEEDAILKYAAFLRSQRKRT
jgi:HTH-type transcriptional regulator, competence development regulator